MDIVTPLCFFPAHFSTLFCLPSLMVWVVFRGASVVFFGIPLLINLYAFLVAFVGSPWVFRASKGGICGPVVLANMVPLLWCVVQ